MNPTRASKSLHTTFVETARRIASQIGQMAIRDADGGARWVDLRLDPGPRVHHLAPTEMGLYDGVSGIALFLAALSRMTADAGALELTRAALLSLRQMMASSPRQQPVGLGSGWSGVVYALTRIAVFLGDESLLADASMAASFITPTAVRQDRTYDLMGGAAGAILGLLALHQARPDPDLLDRASACGWHLVSRRIPTPGGLRSWPSQDGLFLTGASHGAAGIAYCLHLLGTRIDESAFLAAAHEAIAYEATQFYPIQRNWADLRFQNADKPSFMTSWCHGAPGIGLSRLGCLECGCETEMQDLDTALETTLAAESSGLDQLCCGDLGRAELLLAVALRLDRPELVERACDLSAEIAERAERTGFFRIFLDVPGDAYSPGLFRGTAGIGYELLRLASPAELPSLLLFE